MNRIAAAIASLFLLAACTKADASDTLYLKFVSERPCVSYEGSWKDADATGRVNGTLIVECKLVNNVGVTCKVNTGDETRKFTGKFRQDEDGKTHLEVNANENENFIMQLHCGSDNVCHVLRVYNNITYKGMQCVQ